jgi:hypothetical protein
VTRPSRAKRTAGRKSLTAFVPPEHDPLSDSRLRPLVERYASLARARLVETGPHLLELRVPKDDRPHFGGRERVLVAFTPTALEHSGDAEMAVVGSPFVEQLLAAIRARGVRLPLGLISPSSRPDATAAELSILVRNAAVEKPRVRVARHPVGRLLARVLIRAGASVEEHLGEGAFFDLATGTPLPPDAAESCAAAEQGALEAVPSEKKPIAELAPPRRIDELVTLMVADLRSRLASRVDQLRAEAERALAAELQRIDRYYRAVLESIGAKESDGVAMADAGRAIEAEHARRRLEEERRHQVRAVVHPLQIIEMEMVVQRAEWTLSTTKAERVTLAARRFLGGRGSWSLTCPTCTREPSALIVCRDQIACDACAHECSVCHQGFTASDGPAACHLDDKPACADHTRTCFSCGRQHCSTHEGECAEEGHRACASCLAPCAHCAREVCASHAVTTGADAPAGSRRLCSRCVAYCEGRRSEPVGRDEAAECATCERFVCEQHQATCDADGNVHCATHLARTDQSKRLLCESHRSSCAHEPDVIFGSDEVSSCPVCERPACPQHTQECASCGRRVCVGDRQAATSSCVTCERLAAYPNPSASELAAATDAADGHAPDAKKWRAARDRTHLVVEVSQGWRRRLVFTVRTGEPRADTIVVHTRGGAQRKR